MSNVFGKNKVQEYIDAGVAHWTAKHDQAQDLETRAQASYYLDAFSSMKSTLIEGLDPKSNVLAVSKVQDYIDQAIKHWRERQLRATTTTEQHQAVHYQSAFQAARSTLLGSMLPLDR